jgi:hypothetical protein
MAFGGIMSRHLLFLTGTSRHCRGSLPSVSENPPPEKIKTGSYGDCRGSADGGLHVTDEVKNGTQNLHSYVSFAAVTNSFLRASTAKAPGIVCGNGTITANLQGHYERIFQY